MARTLPSFDNECFFIAPIGAEGSPERKRSDGVLRFVVTKAAEELGLTAIRADQLAEPGLINLQVVEHVLSARAAVVDMTGLNPNVFYELAIRHTARLPVALIVEKGTTLPFDIAQMRTIFFDHTDLASADECRQQIVSHLREAIEGGAVDSPIATALDVRALQAGSVAERNIAELVTAVEGVARSQRTIRSLVEELLVVEPIRLDPRALDDVAFSRSLLRELVAEDPNSNEAAEALDRLERALSHLSRVSQSKVRARFVSQRREREVSRRIDPFMDEGAHGEPESVVIVENPAREKTEVIFK